MKKGFNNITEKVQEIWTIQNLKEAKDKLTLVVENDLYKATKTKKYNFIQSIKKANSLNRIYQIATSIMYQDDKSTASFQNL
jgi:hypothetical protein